MFMTSMEKMKGFGSKWLSNNGSSCERLDETPVYSQLKKKKKVVRQWEADLQLNVSGDNEQLLVLEELEANLKTWEALKISRTQP